MNYIVIDLEWNQSTTGKNKELKSLPFEIIEIGAVKLNDDFEIIDNFQATIRPVIYSHLNHISQEITGFTAKELKDGELFPSAFRHFRSWCGSEEYRFCTWGPLDVTELQRNMKHYHFPLLKPPVFFYDIQEIFSHQAEDGNVRRSLEYVVNYYNIEKQNDFHRALNDAYYTALIMKQLDKNHLKKNFTVDTFQKPSCTEEEIYVVYDDYKKYISRTFPSRLAAMHDKEVISTKCCVCNKRLRRKIQWFSENNKNYYSLAYCPSHGYVTAKLRLKKADGETYFALKDLRNVSDDEAKLMYEKRSDYQRKRRIKRHQNKGE